MSYSKNNPPWLATSSTATPSLQAQIGLANPMLSFQAAAAGQPPVFSQPQAPPPPNISLITQMAAAASVQQPPHTLYTQTVSYPAPRPIAYPQMQALHSQSQQMSPQMPPSMQVMPSVVSCPTVVQSNIMATQRAYHGTVTKIQGDVGFIDDEIFFHKSVVCKGSMPKVGEQVFVEASYASNTPFKWNASRVQLLTVPAATKSSYNTSSHLSPSGSGAAAAENGGYNRISGIRSSGQSSHHRERSPRRSTDRKRDSGRDSAEQDRRRTSRPAREEVREKRERRGHPSPTHPPHADRRDQRSPATVRGSHHHRSLVSSNTTRGSVSPPPAKKRRRVVPRYLVQIPKVSLRMPHAELWELKQRYQNLYVPSDFFHSEVRWAESFTPDNPFVLRQPCAFQLMHKEIAPPPETATDDTLLDPPDADHSFAAKVMLMSVPPMADIYRQCFVAAEHEEGDPENGGGGDDSDRNLVHPSRMISFLVGMKGGKNETMAIGGAWSPSLDGKHPESDPTVLIRTAIRTCKALTGIDLSRCTQWYRFVELYYRRESGRVQTVVVFMPDVRSCVPTADEWIALKGQYKMALQRVLDQNHNSSKASNSNVEPSSSSKKQSEEERKTLQTKDTKKEPAQIISGVEEEEEEEKATDADQQPMETEREEEEEIEIDQMKEDADPKEQTMEMAVDDKAEDTSAIEEANGKVNEAAEENAEAEHQQELEDVKAMKMPELREALTARNLPTRGLKADLVERLKEALESESKEKTPIAANEEEQGGTEEEEKSSSPQHTKDESNESLEDGEPDLANMIVIDEVCDPLKQQPTQNTSIAADEEEEEEEDEKHLTKEKSGDEKRREKETVVVKKLTEKDIRQLQRRYTLPETPEIIVHPSRTAKGGKFDCALMSLSVLLDYGLDDSKEHSFEVYLFAELFNEMLMRDSGFNIYKALEGLPERKTEAEADERAKREKKEVATTGGSGEGTTKEGGGGDGRKREAKERKKQITVYPELLLSFAYFDQSLCGYILCKDLEDLMSSIGLGLSKSQIRKVVKKGTVSDSLYYRKLTDKDKEEAESKAAVETVDANVTVLAKGNAPLLPVFKVAKIGSEKVTGKSSSRPAESAISGDNSDAGALVMFNGTLVNVEQLMERIKRAERGMLDAVQLLVDVKKDNAELSASNLKANTKIKDLTMDLKSATKKLGDSEATAHSLQRKNSEYLSVITTIQDKIAPCLAVKRERSSSGKETKVEVRASGGNGGKPSAAAVEEKVAKKDK